jgi:hypothetical protein
VADLGEFDRRKMALLRFGLTARSRWPGLFAGDYRPLEAGPRKMAFARRHGEVTLAFIAELSGTATAPEPETAGAVIAAFPVAGEDSGLTIRIAAS